MQFSQQRKTNISQFSNQSNCAFLCVRVQEKTFFLFLWMHFPTFLFILVLVNSKLSYKLIRIFSFSVFLNTLILIWKHFSFLFQQTTEENINLLELKGFVQENCMTKKNFYMWNEPPVAKCIYHRRIEKTTTQDEKKKWDWKIIAYFSGCILLTFNLRFLIQYSCSSKQESHMSVSSKHGVLSLVNVILSVIY